MKIKSGIYKIQSLINDRIYVGSAINLKRRKTEHFKRLLTGTHPNVILKRHYKKHGKNSLEFIVIEYVENKDLLIQREQHYIDTLNPYFNICRVAGSTKGVRQSEETKIKRANILRGKTRDIHDKLNHKIAAMNRHGEIQQYENGFEVIGSCIMIKGRYRVVLAVCPVCKIKFEFPLSKLRKRDKRNCGCIRCIKRYTHERKVKVYGAASRSIVRKDNKTSNWSGIAWCERGGNFRARIKYKGKLLDAGRYACPTRAVIGRDKYIKMHNLPHPTQVIT